MCIRDRWNNIELDFILSRFESVVRWLLRQLKHKSLLVTSSHFLTSVLTVESCPCGKISWPRRLLSTTGNCRWALVLVHFQVFFLFSCSSSFRFLIFRHFIPIARFNNAWRHLSHSRRRSPSPSCQSHPQYLTTMFAQSISPRGKKALTIGPVSYTHLTLPTKLEV